MVTYNYRSGLFEVATPNNWTGLLAVRQLTVQQAEQQLRIELATEQPQEQPQEQP